MNTPHEKTVDAAIFALPTGIYVAPQGGYWKGHNGPENGHKPSPWVYAYVEREFAIEPSQLCLER